MKSIDRAGGGASVRGRVARAAAVGCILSIAAAAAGCGGREAVIGERPLKSVYTVENNADGLRVWTDTKARADVLVHIDSADDINLFPQSHMDSIESVARRLRRGDLRALGAVSPMIERSAVATVGYMAGMYGRIVWVIPAARSTAEEDPETFRRFFVETRKFPPASVGEFRVDGKAVTGNVAGIPLTITRLDDLSIPENETAIVDIDLNYFQLLKARDPNYRPGTKALLAFLRQLARAGVRTRLVTVNLANQSNEVPMELRYFGRVIEEALAQPKSLEPPLPGKWELMIQAEDSMRAGRYAAAEALYAEILRTETDDPGIHFAIAVARGFQEKGEESAASALAAYRLDHEYLRGFFQLARVLGAAGKIGAGIAILDTPDLEGIVGGEEMDYQRGVFFYISGRPFDAATYLGAVATFRTNDFGLHTILFRAHREIGNALGERTSLQKLVDIDEGRVRREMPWVYGDLGRLYEESGFRGNAEELYRKYIELHPSDSLSAVFRKKLDAWRAPGGAKR